MWAKKKEKGKRARRRVCTSAGWNGERRKTDGGMGETALKGDWKNCRVVMLQPGVLIRGAFDMLICLLTALIAPPSHHELQRGCFSKRWPRGEEMRLKLWRISSTFWCFRSKCGASARVNTSIMLVDTFLMCWGWTVLHKNAIVPISLVDWQEIMQAQMQINDSDRVTYY